jgi:hypothetical protein
MARITVPSAGIAIAIAIAALVATLAAGAPSPAAADWLVMADGGKVETDGPWKLEGGGRLVVFTRPDGTLASLRASEVDLTASDEATREAEQAKRDAAEAKQTARRESVARLTESELPNAGRLVRRELDNDGEATVSGDAVAGEGDEDAATDESSADREVGVDDSGLQVTTWSDVSTVGGNGTELFGAIQNVSEDTVAQIGLDAFFYDESGELLYQGQGTLTATSIPDGRQVNFRVVAPGVYSYDRVELVPRGVRLATRN